LHEARDFSDGTAKLIDEEVQRILREAEERAYQLLEEHREQLDKLTEALLEREELDRDDVAKLLGPRPVKAVTSAN
jgi:cell division protease FtsH